MGGRLVGGRLRARLCGGGESACLVFAAEVGLVRRNRTSLIRLAAQVSEGLTTEHIPKRLGSMHCMQGGRAYTMHARGCHGVMVVLQWLPGHYTIGVRWYMAGGHGSMMWVHLGEGR